MTKKYHNLNINKYNAFKSFVETIEAQNEIHKEKTEES